MTALGELSGPMACPGCAAVPASAPEPAGQAGDIMLSLPAVHCVSCIRTAEDALSAHPGVASVRVNLSLRRATVTPAGPVTAEALARTLAAAGIEAHPLDPDALGMSRPDQAARALLTRLAVAGFAAMNVMLLSVAVWSGAGDATRDLFHWISAAIAIPAVAYCGQPFWQGAVRALRAGRLNMDVPIALALLLALATSLWETALSGHHAYFDAAISLCFFLLIGRYLDHSARASARSAAEELTALEVSRVLRLEAGRPVDVPQSALRLGDLVLVRPGGRIPVDGQVMDGVSELDRSMLTGESAPVPIGIGDAVSAGETNLAAPLTLRATAVGRDTALHRLAGLVAAAEAGRARYAPLADRAAALYAPGVHVLAALAFAGWFGWTADLRVALNIAAAVLIITCPCALGLAVPAVTAAASGRLFRLGLLVKDATALERLAEVDTVVFDKTGTLTTGMPRLANPDDLRGDLAAIARALAEASDHPMSRAIVAALHHTRPAILENLREVPGQGVQARYRGRDVRLGRGAWAGGYGSGTWLSMAGQPAVPLRFDETLRPGARQACDALRAAGLHIAVMSGDEPRRVKTVARALGIEDWRAACTPADKAGDIARRPGCVLMVGDGLNDTAALAAAHVSVAPGSALDAARVASDIVLLGNELSHLPLALDLARTARRRITQNLRIATWYNLLAVPLAVAGLVSPLIAALAMSASSVTVSVNAVRLR